MPSSRPSASAGVKEKSGKKYFTPEEANRALPLVRRIVRDVVGEFKKLVELQQKVKSKRGKASDIDGRLAKHADHLNGLVAELGDIGVELKDWETGLVDFPALREDKIVYLCWKLDEERVGYWHDPSAGFAGREPIDAAFTA